MNEYCTKSEHDTVWLDEEAQATNTVTSVTDQKKAKKQNCSTGFVALILALSMIISAVFGAGGGFVAYKLLAKDITKQSSSTVSNSSGSPLSTVNTSVSGEALSTSGIVSKAAPSVVEIVTESVATSTFMQQYVTEGAGSGVILTADGYIVTNNHVIDGATKITVTLYDGTAYEATLVGTDEQTDIAVLKIEATGLTPATFADSDTLAVGQKAVAIGNPLGTLGGTVTEGIISALNREITIDGQTMTLLQTDTAVNPGNSGGGLFDEYGNLVGIVNAKSSGSDVEGLGFAIPSNTVNEIALELIENGYVTGRVSLGITLIEISDNQTAMMYRVSKLGIYILEIEDGSNAQKAGLQVGDYVVSIGGTAVSQSSDISGILDNYSIGDTVPVIVERDGIQQTYNVKLAETVK